MGLTLLVLIICLMIGIMAAFEYGNKRRRISCFARSFGWSILVGLALVCVILYASYYNTVDMKERLVNISAYKHSIETYAKRASAVQSAGELTDMKYQNYQKQIGEMIIDLRKEIVIYNSDFVGKIEYKKSWFWSWIIFPPPLGSQVLDMAYYID